MIISQCIFTGSGRPTGAAPRPGCCGPMASVYFHIRASGPIWINPPPKSGIRKKESRWPCPATGESAGGVGSDDRRRRAGAGRTDIGVECARAHAKTLGTEYRGFLVETSDHFPGIGNKVKRGPFYPLAIGIFAQLYGQERSSFDRFRHIGAPENVSEGRSQVGFQ